MKRQVVWAFVVLCCGGLFMGGCAGNEAVKKDESLAPAATGQAKQAEVKPNQQETKTTGNVSSQPSQTAQAKTGQTPANAEQLSSALEKIYFDFDASTLSDKARTILTENAGMMRHNPAANVRIEGNCDERGSSEYNLALGERRAKAAKQYMVTLGIAEKRLSVISYGKEKPAVSGNDEAAWAQNRRDEFVVVTK